MDSEARVERRSFWWADTLFALLAGAFGAWILSAFLLVAMYGTDIDEWPPAAGFWIILPAQMICQFGMIMLLSRQRGTGNLERDIGLVVEPKDAVWLLAGPAALFAFGILGSTIRVLMGLPEDNPQALLDTVSEFEGTITVVAIVFGIGVLGPLVEEVTFRGLLLQTGLNKGLTVPTATLISAAVFSLVHLVDWSLASKSGAVTLFMLFLLGVFLAQVRLRTGSLGAAIFVHSGFNMTTVLALFLLPDLV